MFTIGTIKKINRTPHKSYVLVLSQENEKIICSTRDVKGLSEGEKVVVEGERVKSLMQNAMVIKAKQFSNTKRREK